MPVLKLHLDQIVVPENRQRTETDPERLAELLNSIESIGLLHPIVVRGGADGRYVLVAGGRRLQAITNLAGLGQSYTFGGETWDPEHIPAVHLGELSPLEAEEAELEENIRRVDLSVQDRIAAVGRLAKLRAEQAKARGEPTPTVAAIAQEVRGDTRGRNQEDTRREIILADHLDKPYVKSAKTLDEAWKGHLRAEEDKRREELAKSVGASFSKNSHRLVLADCVEWIKEQPAGQFDVILTDPPYGIGADEFGDAGGRLTAAVHRYSDNSELWYDLIGKLGALWYKVAKDKAHLYLCCDIDGFHKAREWLSRVGWRVHRTPIVNYKLDGSRVPWPQHGPQRKWELVLYAVKGDKPVTGIYPDVIETRGDPNFGHGAQKPVALYVDLLKRSVSPGDSVLDCFGGTGTILVACHQLKCVATYVEIDPVAYGIAVKRLQELP